MLGGEIKIIARKMGVMETITIVIVMNSITFTIKSDGYCNEHHFKSPDLINSRSDFNLPQSTLKSQIINSGFTKSKIVD